MGKISPSSAPVLRVALVGNPNTGKTTLFNRLTGARQKIGNYPGVTVERKSGTWAFGGRRVELVDLPGAYSLAAASPDELVAFDFLTGHLAAETAPDAVICVVDASNLVRNLFLASQVADLGLPLVIALNMSDAAEKSGIRADAALLSRRLGVPVVRTVATKGEGIEALEKAVNRVVDERACMAQVPWPEAVGRATSYLRGGLEKEGVRPLADGELRRVLFDRQSAVLERAGLPAGFDPAPLLSASRDILAAAGFQPLSAEALLRYEHLGHLTAGAVDFPERRQRSWTERIDAVLTHRVWGLVIFVAMMFVVFQSIYTWAGPFMGWIEKAVALVQQCVAPFLDGWPAMQSLVIDGVIGGVGGVVVFLPQILVLFFFISLLEDTGYMARGAFLMDKMFGWCGLNGKSFVPMLSSYACAIPGVLATRTIEDPRARLTTILVSPLMSCSARLPVYVLMIGAFIEPSYGAGAAGFALFAMHFVGLVVAVPVAWTLNRFVFGTRPQPFLLEMPPYRLPRLRDILWRMWERAREFLVRAGTVIIAMTIVIWALVYFPRPDSVRENIEAAAVTVAPEETVRRVDAAYIEQSYLARAGRVVQPLFAPAGFDWKITVGVLASFPAREVIIATLGTIYGIGADVDEESGDLRKILAADLWTDGPRAGKPVFTVPVALAIMVFFALCLQCGATVAVMAKESGWGWAVFAFCYMTVLAWAGAVLTYQLGTRFLGS
ncbi:MAG: ferrous iron transport protein B [Chthoniobacterales bacterium]|nr:ferrous iron transport protein B [Chthoniobacterales bacterium]